MRGRFSRATRLASESNDGGGSHAGLTTESSDGWGKETTVDPAPAMGVVVGDWKLHWVGVGEGFPHEYHGSPLFLI